MIRGVLLFFFMFVNVTCGDVSTSNLNEAEQPGKNIIILLDLSDRLLNDNQIERDSALILSIFEEFKRVVRDNFFIYSKDAFKVVIAPQKGMDVDIAAYEDDLRLDMSVLPINKKKKALNEFIQSLSENISDLYQEATEGKKRKNDFFGADIWTYFNESLLTELSEDGDNYLFVFTDGYITFEDKHYSLQKDNRYSNCHFMYKLRNRMDWKRRFDEHDYGIIPVDKNYKNLAVFVSELAPRKEGHFEFDILKAIWQKWLGEMNINKIRLAKVQAISKTKYEIRKFLKN